MLLVISLIAVVTIPETKGRILTDHTDDFLPGRRSAVA
jgi:hypothetical protein